jgi:transposase InsO family protein
VTRVIDTMRPTFGVEPVCRVLGVPVSTYYARTTRKPSRRALEDEALIEKIHAAREGYRAVYGVRKTWRELARRGTCVGRDRVARLMRTEGLRGVRRGQAPRTTAPGESAAERARDLVKRNFTATHPNELWVADLTYIRTWQGFSYLAFILDVYARMLVGWQIASHMRSDLVVDALEMAVGLRRPGAGLIAHTDRGSQYTSVHYTARLDELGIAPSVGSKGDAYDNAMAEAWVGTFKAELVAGRVFRSLEHAEHEVLPWISFYNQERLHEELGDVPPAEFERSFHLARARGPVPDLVPEPVLRVNPLRGSRPSGDADAGLRHLTGSGPDGVRPVFRTHPQPTTAGHAVGAMSPLGEHPAPALKPIN